MTVSKYNDIVVANMQFTELSDSNRIASKKISFITYNGMNMMLQTPTLITEAYGIPRKGEFYKEDKTRNFYKLPFCHERKQQEDVRYDQVEAFYKTLREIDIRCSSVEFRKQMFGDKFDKYRYSPLVRDASKDEEQPVASASYKPPYTKLKIQLDYRTQKPLVNIRDGLTKETKDVDTIDDCSQYLGYMSKVRFIIHFNKFYLMKASVGNGQKQYGITLAIKHVEFFQKPQQQPQHYMNTIAFLEDDDEDAKPSKETRITRKRPVEQFDIGV